MRHDRRVDEENAVFALIKAYDYIVSAGRAE